MQYQTILWDITDGVATLTLNRPERLNAFTRQMHGEIRDAIDQVERPGAARVLVLTGAGRAFSAGQDLEEASSSGRTADFDAASTLEENYNPLLKRLRALPFPVITAVNGIAAGAGASLALAGDLVIATRGASFLQAFARIGLIPDAGGTYFLPRLVGMARSMGMALCAEPVPAETAAQWGLIWKCVDDDRFRDEVAKLAGGFAKGPTRAYDLIKQSLYASSDNDFDAQLAIEAALQRQAGQTEDFAEGVKAFLEKRPPRYKGA